MTRRPRRRRRLSSTCFSSFRRSSPLLTKIAVTLFPSARFSSTARVVESTPPLTPSTTRLFRHCARNRSISPAMKFFMLQVLAAPATVKMKLARIFFPSRLCTTSGWNWTAKIFFWRFSMAATAPSPEWAMTLYPGAKAATESPWLIQTWLRVLILLKRGDAAEMTSSALPYSRRVERSTRPPSVWVISCMP